MNNTVTDSLSLFFASVIQGVGQWGPKLFGGLIALIIGLWIIKMIMKGIDKMFEVRNLDVTLRPFLHNFINFCLKVLLFVSIAGIIGVPTASFAALIAGIGLAIGSAMNGSLGHIASGVMLLVFKPFKVGDLIESNGFLGTVKEISIFNTVLDTFQNQTIIVPNSAITAAPIKNLTKNGTLRIDMPFNIRYGADVANAKAIIENTLANDAKVLKEPKPRVGVNNLGENGIELMVMPYANTSDYWDVFWDTREKLLAALGNAGYEAALPQRVVTMKN